VYILLFLHKIIVANFCSDKAVYLVITYSLR